MASTSSPRRNRYGVFAANAPESPDLSKFFVGGWADRKSKEHEIIELFDDPVEPRAPIRPKTPVSGRSRNVNGTIQSSGKQYDPQYFRPRPNNAHILPRKDPSSSASSSSTASYRRKQSIKDNNISPGLPKWPAPTSPRLSKWPAPTKAETPTSSKADEKSSQQSLRLSSQTLSMLNFSKFAGCASACNKVPPNCFINNCPMLPAPGSRSGMSFSAPQQTILMKKLWADKHYPDSLAAFSIHQEQAQTLKQLVSAGNCYNLLVHGPVGTGKKTLIRALLREIFGSGAVMSTQEIRHFDGQKNSKIRVPIITGSHHAEVNLGHVGQHFRSVLATLLKEMQQSCDKLASEPESEEFRVLVLHNAENTTTEAQQHIRYLMDRHRENIKLIFCCEQADRLLESIQSRCAVISVKAPTSEEVVQVLQYVAREEKLNLPTSFARRIAKASGSNLRQAVLSLEACHLKEYPFKEDQPIVSGWEGEIVTIAYLIVEDQTAKRLFEVRGKIHKLLEDGVPPKLIHRSLVEELVKLMDGALRVEVYRWAKFYARKMPDGSDAIFKLEEFIAKLMSIYKKRHNHLYTPRDL